MNAFKTVIILISLLIGTLISIYVINSESLTKNIIESSLLFLTGISILFIALNKKFHRINHSTQNNAFRQIIKNKFLFLFIGIITTLSSLIMLISSYHEKKNSINGWTEEIIQSEINNCINSAGKTAVDYPNETREYCSCAMNSLKNHIKYSEYQESVINPADSINKKKCLNLIKSCIDELQRKIQSANK